MTRQVLRVPRQPPLSPAAWFKLLGPSAAFLGGQEVNNAVYYNGKTYIGYVDGDGNVRVSSYSHATRTVVTSPVIVALTADRHITPAVLIRQSDHKILVAVAPHNTAHMYVSLSTNAEDISAFGASTDIASTLAGTSYTYAHLIQLSGESGKIYLFYRDRQAPNILAFATSTNGGSTWSAQTQLFQNVSANCYWVIGSDATSRIDFVTSDGSASAGETASLYHFYYTGGSYYKSDGTLITASLPLAPASLTKIFDGATNGSVRSPQGVFVGSPLTAGWVAYDTGGSSLPTKYWYGVYSGGAWSNHLIVGSGKTPDITSILEGGFAIDQSSPTTLYLSLYTSGQWEMFVYTTADAGATWTATQLTFESGSEDPNIRPVCPVDAAATLKTIWSYGPLGVGDLNFGSQIRGYPNPVHI